MSPWIRIGAPLMAVVLGIIAGTAAYAMRDDAPAGTGAESSTERSALLDHSTNAAGICLEGAADCNDTAFGGGGSDAGCTPEECGLAPTPYCPTVDTCADPGMPVRSCPEDMPADSCAQPLPPTDGGYVCVFTESDPPTTECKPIGCPDSIEGAPCGSPCAPGGPVTILPAPAPDEPITNLPIPNPNEPAIGGGSGGSAIVGEATAIAVDGGGTEPGVEPLPVDPPVCWPVDPCGPRPLAPGVRDELPIRCLPPDCSVSSDGAIACPEPPPPCTQTDPPMGAPEMPCVYAEPCTGEDAPPCACASNGTETYCKPLSPECTIDSDGGVSCGGSAPTEPICPDDPTVSCANSGATTGSSGTGSSNAGSASSPPVPGESR